MANTVVRAGDAEVAYEPSDVDVRGVVRFGGAFILILGVLLAGVAWLARHFMTVEQLRKETRTSYAHEPQDRLPPQPRLEGLDGGRWNGTAPQAATAASAQQRDSYGWVDREKRIVHIPIDRAMAILAEREAKAAGATGRHTP